MDLGERLDITLVGALHGRLTDALREAADADGKVVLDGARLEHIDTAGVQLLVAFARAAEGRWRWAGGEAPAAVTGAAARLGLSDALGGAPDER